MLILTSLCIGVPSVATDIPIGISQYVSYACMALVVEILYTTSTTWYTISRGVMLFYVLELVYRAFF